MNLRPSWTLQALQGESGLPKATLSRLLSTLGREGYVLQEKYAGNYRLSNKVRELTNGYAERDRLVDLASPVLFGGTATLKWPLAIGTLEIDAIKIRYSTSPNSPLALYRTNVGQRRELLTTAMGRAYLAFCSEIERAALFDNLTEADLSALSLSRAGAVNALGRIRTKGYAMRYGGDPGSSATLAVPVAVKDDVIAVLSMTTFTKSMKEDMIARFVSALYSMAGDIAAKYMAPG
jgi:IclR family mhp operon transcriptional activator